MFDQAVDNEHCTKQCTGALYILIPMFRTFTNHDSYTPIMELKT
jgi:hypothetical protein